jgi:hypothetical protein
MLKFSRHVSALRMTLQFLVVFSVGKILVQDKRATARSLVDYPLVRLLLVFFQSKYNGLLRFGLAKDTERLQRFKPVVLASEVSS